MPLPEFYGAIDSSSKLSSWKEHGSDTVQTYLAIEMIFRFTPWIIYAKYATLIKFPVSF